MKDKLSIYNKRLLIDNHWEILFIGNNTVFFHNIYGNHFRLRNLSPSLIKLLEDLENCRLDELLHFIARTYGDSSLKQAEKLLKLLIEEGVLIEENKLLEVKAQFPKEYKRFKTQIDWFSSFVLDRDGSIPFNNLRNASAALVGIGGAGSLCAVMLASTGIGQLTLIDGDRVEHSNLVRQLFYTDRDAEAARLKVDALSEFIMRFSPYTKIISHPYFIDSKKKAVNYLKEHDIVIQTADMPRIILNRIVNEACVQLSIPYIYSFIGQVGPLYLPGRSACFACLEAHWRKEAGEEHEMIVEALKDLPTRQTPSIVNASVQIADVLFTEVFAYLSKLFKPYTLNSIIRIEDLNRKLINIQRRKTCMVCGNLTRKRP